MITSSKHAHTRNRRFLGVPPNKSGQMEIIGLVVIVILITLGMLFMAWFALKEEPTKNVFTRKGLASSSLSSMLKVTLSEECGLENDFIDFGNDLLEDCALNYDYSPEGFSNYKCDNKHSCVFAKEFMVELLNDSLGQWNKRYELRTKLILSKGQDPIEILGSPIKNRGGCPKSRGNRDSSSPFNIKTKAGLVELELFVCD